MCQLKGTRDTAGHTNRIQSIKYNFYNENILYSGGWDKTLVVHDLRIQEPALSISGPVLCGESLDVHPIDGLILTGSHEADNCIELWDLRKTNKRVRIIDWSGGIKDSDGKWVVEHESDYTTHQKKLGDSAAFLYCSMFSRDGSKIIAGGGTGKNQVRVFNYDDGQLISAITDLPQSVYCLDYGYSKNNFVFGSGDGALRFVNIK